MVLALFIVSMTGCVGGEPASKSGVTTLVWYTMKLTDNMSSQEIVEREANKILEEKLGANISFRFIDRGNYYEKMNTIIAAGEEFDICFQSDVNHFLSNVKNGAFVAINDMLEEYCPDILEKNEEFSWDAVTVNDQIYAVKSQGAYTKEVGLVFKKDLVEKYGFDYESVTSLADIEPYLETIKQNEPYITPMLINVTDKVSHQYTDDSIKGLVYNEESGLYEKMYEVPLFIERYRLLSDYYQKGYIAKDAITRTELTSEAMSGNYAVMGDSGFYSKDGSKSSAQYGFPCVEAYMGQTIINPKGGAMNCISSTSKTPELALKVLNLIWSDPYLSNTLAYGVEGVNYQIDEERSAQIGSKSVIPAMGNDSTWTIYHNYIGPLWDQWDSSWNRIEALETMQEMIKTAPISGTLGFVFDTEPVKTEYARVTSIISECEPVLKSGSMDDYSSYLKDVQRRLDEAGIGTILEEANQQLNTWKNKKNNMQ
jgi:putative aldouronate transport system substrate-binding protein